MKKLYSKITKSQWRVSIPGVVSREQKKEEQMDKTHLEVPNNNKKNKRTSSGSYDLQQAQFDFDQKNQQDNHFTVVVDPVVSSESEDSEENYQDANNAVSSADELESSFYVDAISSSNSPNKDNGVEEEEDGEEVEYDVPRIRFSFFEQPAEYETVTVSTTFLENDIRNEEEKADYLEEGNNKEETLLLYSCVDNTLMNKHKSEIEMVVNQSSNSIIETKIIDLYLTKSLEDFDRLTPIKSGSDPNLFTSLKNIPEENTNKDDQEDFYKVPLNNRRCRLSQSLTDFNIEDEMSKNVILNPNTSEIDQITTEHVSCSQTITENGQNLDYCKTRSKLPLRLRRATLLRKPKNKAMDTWSNFRTKVGNLMAEHATKQKTTNNEENGKIEELYKNSRDKCKKMLKSTGKMINNKLRRGEQGNEGREGGDGATTEIYSQSQIVKNDAFFAKVRLKATDIEYQFNGLGESVENDTSEEGGAVNGFATLRTVQQQVKKSKSGTESQSGFEDLRKYVKQGGDFCKELSVILQERSEAELQYSKSLAKLSAKLSRACRDNVGLINEAWRAVAYELEARAEAHRILSGALAEDAARPLRNLNETQHKARKQTETTVDKSARALGDWRVAEAKGKKHSHNCARENEKLQDQLLDVRLSRSTSLIQLPHMHNQKSVSEKETAKLEGKKRKAEDAVKKADIEYYTLCVRAERSRLEWESAVLKGSNNFQSLEDERLNNLKTILTAYLHHSSELGPRIIEATERLKSPVHQSDPSKDLTLFINLRNTSQQLSEQLLPDFYCEHITLAMNRERRKQALIKLLHLIRQDIERERKSKNGLENLSKAMKQTPNFGAEDSQQNVCEKLYHMKSMLTYLEGARYKVQSALFELDNRPKAGHPLAPHITITRDKSGLQHSVLKVPQWLREEWSEAEKSPVSVKSEKSEYYSDGELLETDHDWTDRGAADGNSNQPDSDFDEFSSQASSTDGNCEDAAALNPIGSCRALYAYTPNLPDELTLNPGDVLSVYRKQDDGWWLGECNGNVGIFPATYVIENASTAI